MIENDEDAVREFLTEGEYIAYRKLKAKIRTALGVNVDRIRNEMTQYEKDAWKSGYGKMYKQNKSEELPTIVS